MDDEAVGSIPTIPPKVQFMGNVAQWLEREKYLFLIFSDELIASGDLGVTSICKI